MKKILLSLIAIIMAVSTVFASLNCEPPTLENGFLGMWGIDIEGGGVGWLNVHDDQGFLDAELMWIGGSVVPVSHVYLVDENTLMVTRTGERVHNKGMANERTHTLTWALRITKNGDQISGTMTGPNWDGEGESVETFTGKRMPPPGPAPDLSKVKYGKSIKLFNGKDTKGWRLVDPSKTNGFKVVDGILTNNPEQPEHGEHVSYGNLRTEQEFSDFNLKVEVNVPQDNNSGIYLRGLYEIQVVDSYGKELDPHNMGAVYSRITPSEAADKPAGEWQTLDITLIDRHVTVIFNGKKIIDNKPVDGPTGGAISSDVFAPGPIYLQGDHSKVAYRSVVITPVL